MTCNKLQEITAREGTVSLAYEEHPELRSHIEECDDCRKFECDEKALDHLISMGQPALPRDLPALIQRKPIWYQPFWGIAAMIFVAAFMIYQNMPSPEQSKGFMENESPEMTIFIDKELEKENLREEMAPQPVTAPVKHEETDIGSRDDESIENKNVSDLPKKATAKQKVKDHRSKPKREKRSTMKGGTSTKSSGDIAPTKKRISGQEKGFEASPVSAPTIQPVGRIQDEISSPVMPESIGEKEEGTLPVLLESKADHGVEEEIPETTLFKNVIHPDSSTPHPTSKSRARSQKTGKSTLHETLIVMRIEVHETSTRTDQKIVNYNLAANPVHTVLVTILTIPSGAGSPFAVNEMITLGTKHALTPGKATLTLRTTGSQNRPFDMVRVER